MWTTAEDALDQIPANVIGATTATTSPRHTGVKVRPAWIFSQLYSAFLSI